MPKIKEPQQFRYNGHSKRCQSRQSLFRNCSALREALFVNSILWNIETWYNLSSKEIEDLELIDRMLLKRIFGVPSSTPTAYLYLELGIAPLRYVIQGRRSMFLHYIITRKEDDLLYKFFKAQLREPTTNDWCTQVKLDLEDLGIEEDFDFIKSLSKSQMSKMVKEAYKQKAFDDLIDHQLSYSKGDNLEYGELKIRGYLKNLSINPSEAKFIFMLRTRMLNFKHNFKGSHLNDLLCPCCFQEQDTQLHLISCSKLSGLVTIEEFNCIFGSNDDKMKNYVKKMRKNLRKGKAFWILKFNHFLPEDSFWTMSTFIECHWGFLK